MSYGPFAALLRVQANDKRKMKTRMTKQIWLFRSGLLALSFLRCSSFGFRHFCKNDEIQMTSIEGMTTPKARNGRAKFASSFGFSFFSCHLPAHAIAQRKGHSSFFNVLAGQCGETRRALSTWRPVRKCPRAASH